jgi:CDP-diacylglycerol--serine O-phosphatidyltransferase
LLAATVHICYGYPIYQWWVALIWMALVGMAGFLMVCTWRFWSAKELNFSRRQPVQLLLIILIAVFLMVRFSRPVLFSMALVYMFSGIWARAAYSWSRRRRQGQQGGVENPAHDPSVVHDSPVVHDSSAVDTNKS